MQLRFNEFDKVQGQVFKLVRVIYIQLEVSIKTSYCVFILKFYLNVQRGQEIFCGAFTSEIFEGWLILGRGMLDAKNSVKLCTFT